MELIDLKQHLLTLRRNITSLTSAKFKMNGNNVEVSLQSKQEILKNDLLTMSVKAKGYPFMLQKNLVLGSTIETLEQPKEVTSRRDRLKNQANSAAKDFDKIYTPEEILNIKLSSGEIKQYCK